MLCNSREGGDGVGVGQEVREGGYISLPVADSCCCMAEVNTTLYSNHLHNKKQLDNRIKAQITMK